MTRRPRRPATGCLVRDSTDGRRRALHNPVLPPDAEKQPLLDGCFFSRVFARPGKEVGRVLLTEPENGLA